MNATGVMEVREGKGEKWLYPILQRSGSVL